MITPYSKKRALSSYSGSRRSLYTTGAAAAGVASSIIAGMSRRGSRFSSGSFWSANSSKVNGGISTAQHDVKTQYRSRKQTKRQRRNRVRRYKRFIASQLKVLGTSTVHYNNYTESGYGLIDTLTQGDQVHTLYGDRGAAPAPNEVGQRDLTQLVAQDPAIKAGQKLVFDTATMDVTMSNVSTVGEGDTRAPTIEVDVYDIVYRNQTKQQRFGSLIQEAQTLTPTIGGSSLEISDRGATLFSFPQLISLAKIKILKKTKIILPPNNDATFRIKDTRNRVVDTSELIPTGDSVGFIRPGWTRSLVFIHKATIGDASSLQGSAVLRVGSTRTYKYKWMENQITRDGVFNA